jgi:O-acetylserine/cysteine efflux transporter
MSALKSARTAVAERRDVRSRAVVYAGLLYVAVCWGLNVVLVKAAIGRLDPLVFTALRFVAMTPLVFGLLAVSGQQVRVRRRDVPLLIACAACGYGAYQYFWIFGLANTSAFASALLGATAPAFTLLIVAFTGQERISAGRWVGAATALVGIAIFEGAFAGHATFRLGDALTLLSSLSFAFYNVLAARLVGRYPPIVLVAITMTIGMLMIAPVGAFRLGLQLQTHRIDLMHLGWAVWGPFIFAVVFPIVLTWPVWNYGIARIGPARAGLFGFLVPIVSGFAAIWILGSRLEPHQLMGAAVCLAGMALSLLLGRISVAGVLTERTLPLER